MNQSSAREALDVKADLFKALGHPARLLILTLIKIKPRHGEELAAILSLNPATVSHHLGKLVEAGLLESEQDQYYHTFSLIEGMLDRTLADLIFVPQPGLSEHVQEDAYRA
ncbi:MAG: winged helix-turn-helix transcriptional regulator, partial [Anaerolineae bacterium]|nr:winged helix-turn-helix transcriptional regulator [Anaerolineae bacterium]